MRTIEDPIEFRRWAEVRKRIMVCRIEFHEEESLDANR